MKYNLMHKNITVAAIEIDDATCTISSIGKLYAPEHLPVGVLVKNKKADRAALNEWWRGRAIPASRDGIRNVLEYLNLSSTQMLLEKSFGLSLSEQYWICPENANLLWSDINFFDNSFTDDLGDLLIGKRKSREGINQGSVVSLLSPDNTSDGWLRKKWTIIDGKRCLIKGGSGALQQEPYNEVLASLIMRRLSIPHVSYSLIMQDDYPYSICENFITPDTELVSAWYVMQTQKKLNHISVYQHFINCCGHLGISDAADMMDKMIALDFIIANEDRHQNNFGVIRNAETLEYIGIAPIYDNGTSMWYGVPNAMIRADSDISSKPFKTTHNEQIKLVKSFDWLDFSALKGIDDEFKSILKGSVFIDENRTNLLCKALTKRIEMLEVIVRNHRKQYAIDDVTFDVLEDISYSGEVEVE